MEWDSDSITVISIVVTTISIVIAFPNVNLVIRITGAIIILFLISILVRYFKPKGQIDFKPSWILAEKLEPTYLFKYRPFNNQYFPRSEDEILKKLIFEKANILVRGPPLAGKTRTVFEVIKSMGKSVNVFVPSPNDIKREDFFPKNKGKSIEVVILDDLNRFVRIGNFEKLMAIIMSKNLVIVATCQTGDPFKLVERILVEKKLELETIFGENIIDIVDIAEAEARQIAKNADIKWEDTEFDGTIGSIFLKLGEMRERYYKLKKNEKDILKVIKKLQISGIYESDHIFSYELIEIAFNAKYPGIKMDWEHALGPLTQSELVFVPEEKKIHIEEVYLEKIVEFSDKQSELAILKEALNIFSDKPDILYKIANKALLFSIIRVEKEDFAKIAINVYEVALSLFTPYQFPLDYSNILINLGNAYSNLATVEEPKSNLIKAIKAYEEALKFKNHDGLQLDYSITLHNLGEAYRNLAIIEDTKVNLLKALDIYEEALKFRKPEILPLNYANTHNNLGIVYRKLATIEEPKSNLLKAIKAYKTALRVFSPDKLPLYYATTQNNLANAYCELALFENPKENLLEAIKAYKEALKFRTSKTLPLNYANTLSNIGNAYCELALLENPKGNLLEAIDSYYKALKIFSINKLPIDYAMDHNNLGNAYQTLAMVEEPKVNFFKAIKAYEEALKILTPDRLPLHYAQIQNNLGEAHRNFASIENKKTNLLKAINAYETALKIRTFDKLPLDYALTQNNLGTAYGDLAGLEETKNNLQKAIKAYQEALKVYEREKMEERVEPLRQILSNLQAQLQQS